MVTLYVMVDPVSLQIRYVGQTIKSLEKRFYGHCHPRPKDERHVVCWVKSLLIQGLRPLVYEIDIVEDIDGDESERFYIERYRSLGCPLTNLDGGGKSNRNVSDATRAKLSAAKKGTPSANKGKQWPQEMKERISKAVQTLWLDPDYRDNQSSVRLGIKQSAESVAKRASTLRNKPKPKGFRGSADYWNGRSRSKEQIDKQSNLWEVTSPEGEVIIVRNLKQFCSERGLSQGNMYMVFQGKRRQHKGWTCRKIDPE